MKTTLTAVVRDGTSPVTATQTVQPITLAEGEYFEIAANLVGENGTAFPVAGYTGVLTVKKRASDPASKALFARVNASSGTSSMTFVGTQVDTQDKPGRYLFDCWITETATGKSYQVDIPSVFTVVDAVTDLGAPITPAAGAVSLIGVPSPLVAKALLAVNAAGTAIEWSAYAPANPAAWSGSPTTLAEAVDRLAAVLSSLIEGPIP